MFPTGICGCGTSDLHRSCHDSGSLECGSQCIPHVAASRGARTASYVRGAAATLPGADFVTHLALVVKPDSHDAVAAHCSGPDAERAVASCAGLAVEHSVAVACSRPVAVSGRAVLAACSGSVAASGLSVAVARCYAVVVCFYLAVAFHASPAGPVSRA